MCRNGNFCVNRERRQAAWEVRGYNEEDGVFDWNTFGNWWRHTAFQFSDTTRVFRLI
jgi:hypothetical protein